MYRVSRDFPTELDRRAVVEYLTDEDVTLLNRTESRAASLRHELNDDRVSIDTLESAPQHLDGARLVVSALEVSSPVLSRQHFLGREGDVLIVDLGMPRAVASDVSDLVNVRRIDISDLRGRVEQALGDRREDVEECGDTMHRYTRQHSIGDIATRRIGGRLGRDDRVNSRKE